MAGILSSPNIKSLLANASLDLEKKRATLEDVYQSPIRRVSLRLLSDINSIFLSNTDTEKLTSNVTFKFNFTSVSPGMGGGHGRRCSVAHPLTTQRLLTRVGRENQHLLPMHTHKTNGIKKNAKNT